MNLRNIGVLSLTFLALSAGGASGQTFSLDAASPSLGTVLKPDDILNRFPAGGEATLAGVGEEVDAFSYGKPLDDFLSYFPPLSDVFYSIGPSSLGISGTPVRAESQLECAAGDIFRLRLSFGDSTIKLVFDGDGTTAPPLGLSEEPTADNLDALDMHSVPGETVYFSISASSLPSFPPGTSAADVFVMNPQAPGYDAAPPAVRYASAEAMGLAGADDIDALVVFDDGDRVFTPGADVVVFSLAPGSPYIGTGDPGPNYPAVAVTEGDLLVDKGVYGFDRPSVYVDAATLGLSAVRDGGAADDNLDAADMIRRGLGASIGPKWLQQADCGYGLNVQSWRKAGGEAGRFVVDDWLCDGRPIDSVEWQGSYQGWASDVSGVAEPPAESRPEGFVLSWFADSGAIGSSSLLRSEYYPLSEFARFKTGSVTEFAHCVVPLWTGGCEHVYAYEINFPDYPWNEIAGRVYRIAVEAVYANPAPSHPWAWSVTRPEAGWGNPAVLVEASGETNVLKWPSATNYHYAGEAVDMAFSLLTDVWPARCRQRQALPAETVGDDAASWSGVGHPQYDVLWADDFVSDGRPVTDIRWWGSYPGWRSNVTGSAVEHVAPPAGADAPLGFELRLYEHDQESGVPGALTHGVFMDLAECHETYHASLAAGNGGVRHEYVYLADLLDRAGGGAAWPLTNGWRGWLSVQAVFPAGFTQAVHAGWNWSRAGDTGGMPSLVSLDGGSTWTNGASGGPFDLALELGADRVPDGGPSEIAFTAVARDTHFPGDVKLLSEGHCGCGKQVLQSRDDLTDTNGWRDVDSRFIPRPGYTWSVDGTATQRFYRIRRMNL